MEFSAAKIQELEHMDIADRMQVLAKKLTDANLAYHQADAPTITDAEYDALKAELTSLEEPIRSWRGPTVRPSVSEHLQRRVSERSAMPARC